MSIPSVLRVSYAVWDSRFSNSNDLKLFNRIDGVDQREAWAFDGKFVYRTSVDPDDYVAYSGSYENVATIVGGQDEVLAALNTRDALTMWPTEGSRKTVITHNFCDRTTWYQKSVRHVSSALDPIVPGYEYMLCSGSVVDTYHGKITGERFLYDSSGNSYRTQVVVDGATKIESDPHYGSSSGDYYVDYRAGTLRFVQPVDQSASVVATFHRENGSEFVFGPSPAKKLMIKDVEVQFCGGIGLRDAVVFEARGYVDVFAPQYTPVPYPSLTKIPIKTTIYDTMLDYVNESNGALPQIPIMGGQSWRGLTDVVNIFPWNYQAMMGLSYAAGMEIAIYLEHDEELSGSFAIATLYCLSEDE